ncbi:MAG: hypothetical protein K2X27_25810 [Candidatus Obscuribacterales bacterium]|nr:hypothetical protein [Candidatus Obscuribacterales bacterium]
MLNFRDFQNKALSGCKLAVAIGLCLQSTAMAADDVPDYMKIVTLNEGAPASKDKIAFRNVYAINEAMFPIYDARIALYKKHLRERVPLIMGLFSGAGGRFILYPPGKDPIEAPPPPSIYKLSKAVGHCAMVTYDLVAPYCNSSATDKSWVAEMKAYRSSVQSALESIDDLSDIKAEDRELLKDTLKNHILAFMDKCLEKGSFTYDDVIAYTHGVKGNAAKLITLATNNQVAHWFKVLEEWKQMLGKDWDRTYALSNSIYVARQNNILFTVLANFMGEKAINDRLLLMETTDFTASPDDMLTGFVRIISDRALGKSFFNDYYMMDYELLGSGGRRAIEAEAARRGQKALLPPLVPFNSNQWPMRIDPKSGSGPCTLEEL